MDWVIVEVVIGLSFLFFLLSIIASAVNEGIAGVFKVRARMLEKGIMNLVTGSSQPRTGAGLDIVVELYGHSLVQGYSKNRSKPSYLASRSFRNALLDVTGLLQATSEPPGDPLRLDALQADVEAKIAALPDENLRQSLLTIWHSVNHDAAEFRAGVERWFDRCMERVSGWYKRWAQFVLFIVGLALAVILNAGAVTVADALWKDDGVREALLAQVEREPEAATGSAALERLEDLSIPIGWAEPNRADTLGGWAAAIVGWLITAFAVSMGAPFWFDLLGKVSNLRAAGRQPDSVLHPPT